MSVDECVNDVWLEVCRQLNTSMWAHVKYSVSHVHSYNTLDYLYSGMCL